MQEDTYTGDTKDPLSLNLYTYCANNPLIYYDPTGHAYFYIPGYYEPAGKSEYIPGYYPKPVEIKTNEPLPQDTIRLNQLFDAYEDEKASFNWHRAEVIGYIRPFNITVPGSKDTPESKLIESYLKLQYLQLLMLQNKALKKDKHIYKQLLNQASQGYIMSDLQSAYYRDLLLSDPRSKKIIADAKKEELSKIGKQIVIGSSWMDDDEITIEGSLGEFTISLAGGLTGYDALIDVKDLAGDIKNWKNTPGHIAGTVFNGISLFPLIGTFKTVGKVGPLIKAADNVDNIYDGFDDFVKGTSTLAKTGEIPLTGIERFDQLVVGTKKYNIWKSNLKNRGYEVVEKSLKSGNPANIVDNVVEIDPSQFRYIDMLHEKRHVFQDMVSMKQTGNTILNQNKKIRKSFINTAENDAYRYELSLANKYGFSSEYSNYLRGMIGEYSPWIRPNTTVNTFIERLRYYNN